MLVPHSDFVTEGPQPMEGNHLLIRIRFFVFFLLLIRFELPLDQTWNSFFFRFCVFFFC